MNLTTQINPLSRLNVTIVAASLVLGGSLAMIAQSPVVNACASKNSHAPISYSGPTDTTQPATNVSPWSNYQAGSTENKNWPSGHTYSDRYSSHHSKCGCENTKNYQHPGYSSSYEKPGYSSSYEKPGYPSSYQHPGYSSGYGQPKASLGSKFQPESTKNSSTDSGEQPTKGATVTHPTTGSSKDTGNANNNSTPWAKHVSGKNKNSGTDSSKQPTKGKGTTANHPKKKGSSNNTGSSNNKSTPWAKYLSKNKHSGTNSGKQPTTKGTTATHPTNQRYSKHKARPNA